MKKNIITTAIACSFILGMSQITSQAFADNMPFEPVFESVPITEAMTNSAKAETTMISTTKVTPVNTPVTTSEVVQTPVTTGVETENLQNALLQLDGAQVEIRNQLVQYRNEYTELDNQYKVLKEKRSAKAKQIKDTEKRIRNIDSIKEKTRKNMN